jgi:LysR family transcriptional regulator for metE and metH
MELRHLRLVEAVAKSGTLSKAGIQLNLTQSALSHQLREVEDELGTPLFYRMNRKLVLSSAGKIMLKTAGHVIASLEQAKAEIQKEITGETGEINLSTYCYTCYHWLPKMIKVFSNQNGQIQIRILPEYTRIPLQGLLEKKIDLVITGVMLDHADIDYKELFWDQQLAVVAADHPWAKKAFIEPEDFAAENLIIYFGPVEESALYQKILGPNDIRPKKIIEMQLTEAGIEMIKSGLGVKVMASWAIKPYLKDPLLKAIPITRNGLYRTWYLAYHKKAGWKDYYDIFRAHLIQCIRAL